MTRGEIKTEVFRRLREVSAAAVYWSVPDVEGAINDGYAEISDATEWYELNDTITVPARVPFFDIRQFLSGREFLRAGAGFNTTTNRWLTPLVPSELDKSDRLWESRIAVPEYIMMRGIWQVSYWPYAGGTVKQYYSSLPPVMTSDSDEPGFHDALHYGLVEYALWDLWAQDAETDLAWAAWKEYLEYEIALGDFINGRAKVPKVHGNRQANSAGL